MDALDLRHEARAHMPRLPDAGPLRDGAIATWLGRMSNEHASSAVFDSLADQLREEPSLAAHEATVREFAAEERRHGILCGAVVEALGGRAVAAGRAPLGVPAHRDAPTRRAAIVRNVISIACMAETVAVSLIGAERMEMEDGPLRRLLTTIYADEVGHSRFRWRLLDAVAPELGDAERASIDAYLPVAFAHLEEHELAHLPVEAEARPGGEALGLCSGADARSLYFETVASIIVPGLERLGFRAREGYAARHGRLALAG